MNTVTKTFDSISKNLALALVFILPISTTLTQVLAGLLLISWFFSGNLRTKIHLIVTHPMARAALVLFFVVIIGTLYTSAPPRDMLQMLEKMSKILYIPLLIPLCTEEKSRKHAMFAFVAAMTLTLILSLLKVYAGLPITSRHSFACVFKNHIDTNLMMSMAAFGLAHYVMQASNRLLKMLSITLIALMTFYILWMSEGRTGYIIFAVLWLLFSIQRLRLKHLVLGTGLLFLIFGLVSFGPSRFQDRLTRFADNIAEYQAGNYKTSVGQRLEYFTESFTLIKKHPWLGVGTGGFKQAYHAHARTISGQMTNNPHNEYINMLIQWGGIGLLAFLGLLATVYKTSFALPAQERYLAQGIVLAMIVGCFGNSWLMDFTPGSVLLVLTAVCFGAFTKPETLKREAI